MPIFCDPAAQAGALGGAIGEYLGHADTIAQLSDHVLAARDVSARLVLRRGAG